MLKKCKTNAESKMMLMVYIGVLYDVCDYSKQIYGDNKQC